MPVYPVAYRWRDHKGLTSWSRFYILNTTLALAQANASSLVASLTPITNAHLDGGGGVYVPVVAAPAYGANAEYSDSQDKVEIFWRTVAGSIRRQQFPAPKRVIFLADQETADRTQVNMSSLIGAMTANNACDRDGVRLNTFILARRIRVPLHRKASVYLLAPNLTMPAE